MLPACKSLPLTRSSLMATVKRHLAANVRTEHAEEGCFLVFELERDVLDGTSIQRHFTDEGVDAVDNVEVAREVRFGRCGFLLLHRIQFLFGGLTAW